MPDNKGGPWGSGGGNRGSGNNGGGNQGGGNRGGGRPPVNEIDEIVRKGQEQLRAIMGGKSGKGSGGGNRPSAPSGGFGAGSMGLFVIAAIALWLFASVYRVQDGDNAVELFLGECRGECVEGAGINFAPWPVVTKEILPVSRENTLSVGVARGAGDDKGLMLTGDENIVDIDFQVVWNIISPEDFLFNLAAPNETIAAVSESAMREIIARSNLAPILNRDRGAIAQELQELIQSTLNSYDAGVNIVRVNFDRADPPREVIDAFREVQAAEQTRDTLEKQADAYANRVVAEARGESAQLMEQAEGYRAQVVNEAEGEASRFVAVYDEYAKAKDVTRKRLYLETMEKVLGGIDKIILDENSGGQGVVPYLPLNELNKKAGTN
ncbi:HflK protein [Amylibacter ulvae]|uniref:Protein HflK n=1 Tax=Paramylibacter ulvae TaxID=1651968 RepID=A0ABQ3D2A3_9RHOB|nr:FtsH protease activity modulator HflK [Amylibacter ulvae]GHA54959.1 HflK protein [Amylibacter ulvae]